MINAPMNVVPGMSPVGVQPQVQDEKQYNAVAITVHKPTVEAPANNMPGPYTYPQAPIYNYPQASVYNPPMVPEAAPAKVAVHNEPAAMEIQQPQTYQVPDSVIPESVAAQPTPLAAEPLQEAENTAAEKPQDVIARA